MSKEFSKKLQKLSRCSPLHPVHYWDPECAESPASCIYKLCATFVGDKAIESRPTLIRVKGNVSTY